MVVWMYYETDGDAGYYRIALFSTKEKAAVYQKRHGTNGYSHVDRILVDSER